MSADIYLMVLINVISTGKSLYVNRGEYNLHHYDNIAIIQKHNVTIRAYTCDPSIITITDQNGTIKIQTKKWVKSDCADVFEKREMQIGQNTYSNIKIKDTNNFSVIETENDDYKSVDISITLREFSINYDGISGEMFLPSGYKNCYYHNLTCYDPIDNIIIFWDKYVGNDCDSVSLLYNGPADIYTSETVPTRRSLVLYDSNKSYILHMSNKNITLCNNIIVTETSNELLFASFKADDKTLIDKMGSGFIEINPLNVLTLEKINVNEELERYWDNKDLPAAKDTQNQNENSLYEGAEVRPVTKNEIEESVSQQTIPNTVEKYISETIPVQQIIPNRTEQNGSDIIFYQQMIPNSTEQNISDTISDQEPNESRDHSYHTKDNASQTHIWYLIIAYSILPMAVLSIAIRVFIVIYKRRNRDKVKSEESHLCPENAIR